MKNRELAFLMALLVGGTGHVSQANTVELSVHSDRCAIAFALTGKVLNDCSPPSFLQETTRSVSKTDGSYFVNFDFNSNEISRDASQHLMRLSSLLTGPLAYLCVKLVGHTDTKGSAAYNKVLSEKRAQSVRLFLAGPGEINAERLTSEGFGEERPLPGTLGSSAKNRRVEIRAKNNENGLCD